MHDAARGEADDEQEQYEVDFFRKAWMEGGSKDADSHGAQDRQRSASPSTSQPLGKHHQAQYDNQFYYQYSQQQGAPHPSQLQGMYMQYAQHRQHPQQQQQPVDTAHLAVQGSGGMMSSDMSRERERRAWEAAERQRAVQEEEQEEKRKRARQVRQLQAKLPSTARAGIIIASWWHLRPGLGHFLGPKQSVNMCCCLLISNCPDAHNQCHRYTWASSAKNV